MNSFTLYPLSDRIRFARRQANLSQQKLASKVGVNRSAVAQWERLASPKPSMHHFVEIALATGVQLDWLGTGRGNPTGCETESAISTELLLDGVDRELLEAALLLPAHIKLALLKFMKAMSMSADTVAVLQERSR